MIKEFLPDMMTNIIRNKNIILYSDGSPTRTFCYISDAIIGYLKALRNGKKGNVYNIGSKNPEISMKELAKLIMKISKKFLSYKGKIIF